jgi:hypothetical protein
VKAFAIQLSAGLETVMVSLHEKQMLFLFQMRYFIFCSRPLVIGRKFGDQQVGLSSILVVIKNH